MTSTKTVVTAPEGSAHRDGPRVVGGAVLTFTSGEATVVGAMREDVQRAAERAGYTVSRGQNSSSGGSAGRTSDAPASPSS